MGCTHTLFMKVLTNTLFSLRASKKLRIVEPVAETDSRSDK